jgi:hypothetical protein
MKLRGWMVAVTGGGLAIAAGAALGAVTLFDEREVPASPSVYVPADYASVREGAGHRAHVGREDVECADCHDLEQGFESVREGACTGCHEASLTAIHAGIEGAPECTSCHEFRPEGVVANDCARCHREGGEGTALAMHVEVECVRCHAPHDELRAGGCTDCHSDLRVEHAAVTNDADCARCHSGHERAETAIDRCAGCHDGPEEHVNVDRALFTGHDRCVQCHTVHPASDAAGGTAPCASCHADRMPSALVASHGSRCTDCHSQHDARAPAEATCARCHSTVSSDHPATPSGTCTSCHVAHPPAAMSAQATLGCSQGCHGEASSETAFHADNVRCVQCHTPHDFGVQAATLCSRCHAEEQREVAPAAGHAQCTGCHTNAHRPAANASACASCHTTEHATAPEGHRNCASCHRPHDGALVVEGCRSCHAAEAESEHGSSPEAPCASCHRPHGPSGVASPPRCASCHAVSTLPNLHAVPDHRRCNDCHRTHETEPSSDRAACTGSCHEGLEQHEPTSRSCAACHPFGR